MEQRQLDDFLTIATHLSQQGDHLRQAVLASGVLLGLLALLVAWVVYVLLKAHSRIDALKAEAEDLKKLSEVDDLTGLFRRNAGERYAGMATRMFPCVIAFVDVNDLKKTNEREGHVAGDHLLRCVAGYLLRAFARAHDILYRYGGDEFVLVLPAINSNLDDSHATEEEVLDGMLKYAAEQLDTLSERGTLFTYALTTTRLHPPGEALEYVDSEVRALKRQRRELHAATAAIYPAPQEEPNPDVHPGAAIRP